jgi:hypothetical protein
VLCCEPSLLANLLCVYFSDGQTQLCALQWQLLKAALDKVTAAVTLRANSFLQRSTDLCATEPALSRDDGDTVRALYDGPQPMLTLSIQNDTTR